MNRRALRFLMPFALLACSALCVFQPTFGAEFRAEDRSTVAADEVIEDDLYIFGDEVTIDGEVKGDVIALGRVIRLNGSIDGDFIAAGQAIVISGQIGDDVRVAGQALRVDKEASIGDDVIAAGLSFEAGEGSSVGGDWIYAGYQALLAGDVDGMVNAAMANCEINGHIGGDIKLSVDGDPAGAHAYSGGSPPVISMPSVSQGLTIGDSAKIDGGLKYESSQEADIAETAQIIGEIEHDRPAARTQKAPKQADKLWSVASKYLALLVIGFCVVLIAPSWTRGVSDRIKTRPVASLGFGVAGFIGTFALILLILFAMVAFAVLAGFIKLTALVPVAIILGLSGAAFLAISFWFFTGYLATVVLAFFTGNLLLARISKPLAENRFVSLTTGLVILAGLSMVPYLSSIIAWLVVLFGIGALLLWMFSKPAATPSPQHAKPAAA